MLLKQIGKINTMTGQIQLIKEHIMENDTHGTHEIKNHAHTLITNHLASHSHSVTLSTPGMLDEMFTTQLKMLAIQLKKADIKAKQLSIVEQYDTAMEIIK